MPSFLRDLALSHQQHEGYYAPSAKNPRGSLSYRNANPGNLRTTPYLIAQYGAVPGDGGFAKFPSYDVGFMALMDDLKAKITGRSAHIDYRRNPTLLDYVRVYAPSADGNDPNGYAQSLVRDLRAKGWDVSITTPLSDLARLLAEPSPQPSQPTPAVERRKAKRIAERLPEPERTRALKRIAKAA